MKSPVRILGGVLLASLVACPQAARKPVVAGAELGSARAFMSGFYRWYTPLARKEEASPAWMVAIARRPQDFTPELVRLLRADRAS